MWLGGFWVGPYHNCDLGFVCGGLLVLVCLLGFGYFGFAGLGVRLCFLCCLGAWAFVLLVSLVGLLIVLVSQFLLWYCVFDCSWLI